MQEMGSGRLDQYHWKAFDQQNIVIWCVKTSFRKCAECLDVASQSMCWSHAYSWSMLFFFRGLENSFGGVWLLASCYSVCRWVLSWESHGGRTCGQCVPEVALSQAGLNGQMIQSVFKWVDRSLVPEPFGEVWTKLRHCQRPACGQDGIWHPTLSTCLLCWLNLRKTCTHKAGPFVYVSWLAFLPLSCDLLQPATSQRCLSTGQGT